MRTISIASITKRDGTMQDFDLGKIIRAIHKALKATDSGTEEDANDVAAKVHDKILTMCAHAAEAEAADGPCKDGNPTVEEIQDLVEQALMEQHFYEAAKAYIIYRNEHAKRRKRDIFKKRIHLKPYEYPELIEYVDAIRHSYWVHTEFNFMSDVQDFKVNTTETERHAMKNAMLAIAQIEVAVKTFWGNIYKKMPKPEIGAVGFTFAESEVRHQDAYAHLLEILGLNDEFKNVPKSPVLNKRVQYLDKVLAKSHTDEDRDYMQSVLLFSLFIEHVSLFSQFLIIMSFNKHKNLFKGISNAVEATSKEEQIHGLFGIDIINLIKTEHPEWFDDNYEKLVYLSCEEAYEAESAIVDWIFEAGELDFLPARTVKEFVKNRFNNSLASIDMKRIFTVDDALLDDTSWFDDEVIGTKHGDFFVKRSINYNKRSSSVTSADLF